MKGMQKYEKKKNITTYSLIKNCLILHHHWRNDNIHFKDTEIIKKNKHLALIEQILKAEEKNP